ncbi:MAG: hypothetical protein LUC24_03380 [Bacteroidales bacterium]|nr:hypothetical protein [Bacteroidales bacterium]
MKNIRKSIQPEKLRCIALTFPDLNTGWLMTGEGRMLKDGAANISQTGTNNIAGSGNKISGDQTTLQMMLTELAEQRRDSAAQLARSQQQIDKLLEQHDRLISIIENGGGK